MSDLENILVASIHLNTLMALSLENKGLLSREMKIELSNLSEQIGKYQSRGGHRFFVQDQAGITIFNGKEFPSEEDAESFIQEVLRVSPWQSRDEFQIIPAPVIEGHRDAALNSTCGRGFPGGAA